MSLCVSLFDISFSLVFEVHCWLTTSSS